MVSTGLYRFVSVCTNYFCSRIIVNYFTDLYRYGGNTGPETGTKSYTGKIMVLKHDFTINITFVTIFNFNWDHFTQYVFQFSDIFPGQFFWCK